MKNNYNIIVSEVVVYHYRISNYAICFQSLKQYVRKKSETYEKSNTPPEKLNRQSCKPHFIPEMSDSLWEHYKKEAKLLKRGMLHKIYYMYILL